MKIDNIAEQFFVANKSLFCQKSKDSINAEKILIDFINSNRQWFDSALNDLKNKKKINDCSISDKYELIDFLKYEYTEYKKAYGDLPISNEDSFKADLNNWLPSVAKKEKNKTPLRKSLITLVFVLKFTSKEPEKFTIEKANELLQKFKQHKLHYGGDVPESIIYYCLLNSGHTYSHALKMKKVIKELSDDKTLDIPIKESPSYSQRTVAIASDFEFSKTSNDSFSGIIIPNDFFKIIQSKVDKGFSKEDINVICKILISEKDMSIKSNRTLALVHKTIDNAAKRAEENNKKSKKITGTSFHLFFNEEKGIGTWANALSKFKIGYEDSEIAPQPTRDFILLISVLSWSIMEPQISLKDYTNEFLETCQYQYLDNSTLPDLFINEWSNFKIKEGKLYYMNEIVICQDITKKSNLYNAMQIIIKKYFDSYKHLYDRFLSEDFFQLQNNDIFYEL